MKTGLISFFFAALLTLLVTSSFFKPGFFPMHDTTHIARTFLLEKTLASGQIPAVWSDTVNYNYGYPLFHFYAPLAYYLAFAFKIFSSTYLFAVKAVFVFSIFIGAFGMITFLKKYGFWVSLLGAAAFTFLPYKAVDIYVRGALAELLAFNLLPWLFLIWRDLKSNTRSIAITSVVSSFFVLSHNLIPFITAPFLIVWVLYHQRKRLKTVIITGLLTLTLTAFYIVPLVTERNFVRADEIARTTDYRLHFIEPWQIWNSTWGFGGSAPGVEDGMSFKLGKLHAILAALGLIFVFLAKRGRSLALYAGFALLSAIFLTTPYSKPLWDIVVPLQIVQFPWRFLTIAGFAISILCAFSVSLFKSHLLKLLFSLGTITFFLFLNLKYFSPQTSLLSSDSDYIDTSYIESTVAKIIPEYLPRWMPEFPNMPPSMRIISQGGSVKNIKESEGIVTAGIDQVVDSRVVITKAYYPTWKLLVDDRIFSFQSTEDGLIAFDLPVGSHKVVLIQSKTGIELASQLVSLASLGLVLFLGIREGRSKNA